MSRWSRITSVSRPWTCEEAKGVEGREVIGEGLLVAEMPLLHSAVPLLQVEEQTMVWWQDPQGWDPEAGTRRARR